MSWSRSATDTASQLIYFSLFWNNYCPCIHTCWLIQREGDGAYTSLAKAVSCLCAQEKNSFKGYFRMPHFVEGLTIVSSLGRLSGCYCFSQIRVNTPLFRQCIYSQKGVSMPPAEENASLVVSLVPTVWLIVCHSVKLERLVDSAAQALRPRAYLGAWQCLFSLLRNILFLFFDGLCGLF